MQACAAVAQHSRHHPLGTTQRVKVQSQQEHSTWVQGKMSRRCVCDHNQLHGGRLAFHTSTSKLTQARAVPDAYSLNGVCQLNRSFSSLASSTLCSQHIHKQQACIGPAAAIGNTTWMLQSIQHRSTAYIGTSLTCDTCLPQCLGCSKQPYDSCIHVHCYPSPYCTACQLHNWMMTRAKHWEHARLCSSLHVWYTCIYMVVRHCFVNGVGNSRHCQAYYHTGSSCSSLANIWTLTLTILPGNLFVLSHM
jgi:hypothetical protein